MLTKIKVLALASILVSLGLVPTKASANTISRTISDGVILSITCTRDRRGTFISWSATAPRNDAFLFYDFVVTTSEGELRQFADNFSPRSVASLAAPWRRPRRYPASVTLGGSFFQDTGGDVIIDPPLSINCGNQ